MANEKFYVTQEGYNDLVNEHENLVHKVRQEVIVELQEARAQGDLSEMLLISVWNLRTAENIFPEEE